MHAKFLPPLLLFVLLGAFPASADDKKPDDKKADKPVSKVPLGKDTTYVFGPLDKQGYIDYESALNAEMSKGVTADKNAVVLLWAAFGPTPEGGDGMSPLFYKWLDTPAPPKDGEYFQGLGKFARDRLALTDMQLNAVYELQGQLSQRPWEAKDCPPIAEWLKSNEKPLVLMVQATKLPMYYNPLVSRRKDGEPSALIGALLPAVQKCRECASALTARAMLRLGEGKFDAAWEDLLACHRLGRLVSHGGTLIEGLVGIAISAIAANSTLAYLEQAKLTPKQAAERLKDLQNLPKFGDPADKIDLVERFMGLDAIQAIARGGREAAVGLGIFDGAAEVPTPEDAKALEKLDWTVALKNVNGWYDRMAAAMRLKDRAEREKAFDAFEKEMAERKKAAGGVPQLIEAIKKDGGDKVVAKSVTDVIMSLLMPAVRKVQGANDRAEQITRNLQVGFALAAYRGDNGRYPAKLDDLAPKYLAAVPADVFSGKPLIYKPDEKGYLFYSVGQNGKDEGGRWYDSAPPGDDPHVRMPLPPLKKN